MISENFCFSKNFPSLATIFVSGGGNVGDKLIFEGSKRVLGDVPVLSILEARTGKYGVVYMMGSGGWSPTHHSMPDIIGDLEQRCEKLVILPSSFDVSVPVVRDFLKRTRAVIFCRERVSYNMVKRVYSGEVHLDHDYAFHYEYERLSGNFCISKNFPRWVKTEPLIAYRTDGESDGEPVPEGNEDISLTTPNLQEWLAKIARHKVILTDRAHVMIAGVMLGKEVWVKNGNYHKVVAIAEHSLCGKSRFGKISGGVKFGSFRDYTLSLEG